MLSASRNNGREPGLLPFVLFVRAVSQTSIGSTGPRSLGSANARTSKSVSQVATSRPPISPSTGSPYSFVAPSSRPAALPLSPSPVASPRITDSTSSALPCASCGHVGGMDTGKLRETCESLLQSLAQAAANSKSESPCVVCEC
jgi:hypothetical protein